MHLSIVRGCRIAAFGMSAAVALAAVVVLAGYTFGRAGLQSFGVGGTPVSPLTAMCALLLAIALLVELPVPHGRRESFVARTLASLCALVALAKLASLVRLLVPATWPAALARTGHLVDLVAPSTALIILAVSLAVMLLDADVRGRRPSQVLVFVALPLTLVGAVGFLFSVTVFYAWGAHVPMARGTALLLLLLELAVLTGRVEFGVTRIFVAQGAGGVTARRLLPAAVLLPLVIGYARLVGERRGLFDSGVGVVFFTLAMMGLLATLVWWTASSVHRVDLARAEAEVRLQTLIRNVPLGIVVLDLEGRVKFCNDAFVELFHYSANELIGRRVDDFITPDRDGGETVSLTRRGVAGENLRRRTLRRRRDGTLVAVELFVVPLSMNGQPTGTYGVYREIAGRSEAGSAPLEAGIA